MTLQIPARFLSKLIAKRPGQAPPKYKVYLPHGLTYYAIEIDAQGTITRVEGRRIFSPTEIDFSTVQIEDIEPY